jgi:hypothetical protein
MSRARPGQCCVCFLNGGVGYFERGSSIVSSLFLGPAQHADLAIPCGRDYQSCAHTDCRLERRARSVSCIGDSATYAGLDSHGGHDVSAYVHAALKDRQIERLTTAPLRDAKTGQVQNRASIIMVGVGTPRGQSKRPRIRLIARVLMIESRTRYSDPTNVIMCVRFPRMGSKRSKGRRTAKKEIDSGIQKYVTCSIFPTTGRPNRRLPRIQFAP